MTDSGAGEGMLRLAKPVIAYAIVLGLLGWAGFFLWAAEKTGPASRESSVTSRAAPTEPLHAIQGTNQPTSPAMPEEAASVKKETAPAHAVLSPQSLNDATDSQVSASTGSAKNELAREPALSSASSQSENSINDQATSKRPEPPKATCTVDVGQWPIDRTEQVKAIQILMRDLGFYSGTTYGTLGPATRTAIRKLQLATDQAETGEPSEMLFELLKRKCN